MIVMTIKGIIIAFWYFLRKDRWQQFQMLQMAGFSESEAFDAVYYGKVK